MSKVFVLDIDKQPLTPIHPGGARHLLKEGKAAVYRRYPFTIILKRRVEAPAPAPLRLKIDPGAKTTGLARILKQAKAPLKDATAANATRWELFKRLKETGLPLETGSGGRTKYNRTQQSLPKTHWLDAACVGASTPARLHTAQGFPLVIGATGRGHRRLYNTNELGFPVNYRQRHKRYFGFQAGDQVRAVVPEALACRGTHVGRITVRAKGTFDIITKHGKITDVPHRFCQSIGRTNGYRYQIGGRHADPPPTKS